MTDGEPGRLHGSADETDLAKAFQALAQGEQTATQLENHLTKLEARIEELMKQASENQELSQSAATEAATSAPAGESDNAASGHINEREPAV